MTTTINKIINEPTCIKNRALALKSIVNIILLEQEIVSLIILKILHLYQVQLVK